MRVERVTWQGNNPHAIEGAVRRTGGVRTIVERNNIPGRWAPYEWIAIIERVRF